MILTRRLFSAVAARLPVDYTKIHDRKAIDYFLLKNELDPQSSPVDPVRDLDRARRVLEPHLQTTWLPQPLLYKRLNYTPEFLSRLELFEHEMELSFKTRLLLLQAFTHASFARQLLKANVSGAASGFHLLSNDRLRPFGKRVINLTLSDRFRCLMPNISSSTHDHLIAQYSHPVILASCAESLGMGELLQTTEENFDSNTGESSLEKLGNCLEALTGAIYLDNGAVYSIDFFQKKVLPGLEKRVKRN